MRSNSPKCNRLFVTLCLASLGGCATMGTNDVPEALIQDCPEPPLALRTNGDMARGIHDLQASLRACNVDKANLRAWKDQKK
jgi:hypothetical protein